MARSSSSGRRAVARWRSGEPGSLSGLARRDRQHRAGERAGGAQAEGGDRERRARERERVAQEAELLARAVPGAAGQQLERVGGGGRQPVGIVRRGAASGSGSSSSEPSSTAAMPSTMQWCALPTSPMRPSAQPVGDPELPQRAVAAQRLRQHRVGELRQVLGRGAVDVLGGVEVLGVDPQRRVQPQRVGGDALAEARRAAEPAGDVVEQVVEVGRGPSAGGVNVAAHPTCMCALGPSTARNDASSADSRSGGIRSPIGGSVRSPSRSRDPSSTVEASRPRPGSESFYGLVTSSGQMSPEKVSQALASPSSKPRLNQPARCSDDAVRERLGADPPRRCALNAVVADRGGCLQPLLEVALLEQAALVRRVPPHAGEAVRLQLELAPTARCLVGVLPLRAASPLVRR